MYQRRLAARKGFALSQVGLLDRATRAQLDDGTEEGIYRLLGLPFLNPEERQKWADRALSGHKPPADRGAAGVQRTPVRRIREMDTITENDQ